MTEARYWALIEQIPSIVWIEPLGENPEPAFVSTSVGGVFGVSRQEWLHTDWWEGHLHPDDHDRVLDGVGHRAQAGPEHDPDTW